jgi:hypothetical protein
VPVDDQYEDIDYLIHNFQEEPGRQESSSIFPEGHKMAVEQMSVKNEEKGLILVADDLHMNLEALKLNLTEIN